MDRSTERMPSQDGFSGDKKIKGFFFSYIDCVELNTREPTTASVLNETYLNEIEILTSKFRHCLRKRCM